MHLYVLGRGINDELKRWENDLSAIFLPWEFMHKGKKTKGKIRFAIRPVQLYEMVFPEEQLDNVMSAVVGKPNGENIPGSTKNGETYIKYKILNKLKRTLGKVLGLKPTPKRWKYNPRMQIINRAVGVHPIGIKKDKRDKNGIEFL